jgi:hypothetical protein
LKGEEATAVAVEGAAGCGGVEGLWLGPAGVSLSLRGQDLIPIHVRKNQHQFVYWNVCVFRPTSKMVVGTAHASTSLLRRE